MSANERFEFITVTASAYDAATLATKLTAHSAQGWDVVAIVPTGSELTAFCRRPATAETSVMATVAATVDATPPVTQIETPTPAAATQSPATPVASSASVTNTAAAPAGWYADPSGRYELRYWDGGAWSEHVARGGQQFTDPPVA